MPFHTQFILLACLALANTTFSSPLEKYQVCNRDNVLRCLIGASATGNAYCSSYLSIGTVTSYSATTTPITTQTVTETTTPLAKREEPQVKIYGPSPITVVSAGATAVLLARRGLPARAATAPTCLALYSPAAIRLSSACDCLSITSSTITTISIAPTSTTTTTVTSTAALSCLRCNVCSADADCRPGYICMYYSRFPFGDARLCTSSALLTNYKDLICASICV